MNSLLLVLWCNLAVVLSVSTDYQPRGLSVRASPSLATTSYGSRVLQRRSYSNAPRPDPSTNDQNPINNAEDQEEPQKSDASNKHDTSGGLEHSEAALRTHFDHMKKSMKKLEKSFTGHEEDQTKIELEKVFASAKQGLAIVKSQSGYLSSLTGVDKKELSSFFSDLNKSISDLHRALKKSDHKLENAKAFFAHLIKSVSNLQTSSENCKAKSEQVTAFFTKVIQLISKLEEALETPKENPDQASAEIKAFFSQLGENVINLEAQMQEGLGDKTQSN